jgi:hypothetical protein
MLDKSIPTNLRRIIKLATPSSLSAVLCVVASLFISLGALFLNRFRSNALGIQGSYHQTQQTLANSHLVGSIFQNQILNDLPLIVFWAVVGVIVYIFAIDIIKTFRNSLDLVEELDYAHVNKHRLITDIVGRLGIRVIVLAIWLPYILLFFDSLMPYSIRIAIIASTSSNIIAVILHMLISVTIGSLAFHINVIFLRLVFLKPRLFSNAIE